MVGSAHRTPGRERSAPGRPGHGPVTSLAVSTSVYALPHGDQSVLAL